MSLKKIPFFATVALMSTLTGACFADVITIPATANIWLAGMPSGTIDPVVGEPAVDIAPIHSPLLVTGTSFAAGDLLEIAVTGAVGNWGGSALYTPDGNAAGLYTHGGTQPTFGMSNVRAPVNSLVAVFLTDARPDLTPAPSMLDFSVAGALDYTQLAPELKQVFFIGDGLTSSGAIQQIVVPTGATRLYLGIMDSNDWNNNVGSFRVTVTNTSTPVPEPATIIMLSIGLCSLAGLRKNRKS